MAKKADAGGSVGPRAGTRSFALAGCDGRSVVPRAGSALGVELKPEPGKRHRLGSDLDRGSECLSEEYTRS